jgi:phospholipase C
MARESEDRYQVRYGEAEQFGYWRLAREFTLCDHYFSEVAGPSTPNHLMLICADTPPINNPAHQYRPRPGNALKLPSLPAALEAKGLSWGNYGGYAFHDIDELAGHRGNHTRDLFAQHATAGRLPTVSWVYGDGRPDLSEHPTLNVIDGQDWTCQQIQAVIDGGLWETTIIVVTWDDWGGWYDHVTPPVVETWDPSHAQGDADRHDEFAGQPFRYGSRVPCCASAPSPNPGTSPPSRSRMSPCRSSAKTPSGSTHSAPETRHPTA